MPLDERTKIIVGPLANRALISGGLFLRRSTFVPPSALGVLAEAFQFAQGQGQCEVLSVAHVFDAVDDAAREELSLERAKVLAAWLEAKVDAWAANYGEGIPQTRRWGAREDRTMLYAVCNVDPKARSVSAASPNSPQNASSKQSAEVSRLAREFQSNHGLKVDGIIGPQTRKQLIIEYFKRSRPLAPSADGADGGASDGDELVAWPFPVTAHGAGAHYPRARDLEGSDEAGGAGAAEGTADDAPGLDDAEASEDAQAARGDSLADADERAELFFFVGAGASVNPAPGAVDREEQLKRVIPNPRERRQQFVHRRRFSWVKEAIVACKAQAAAGSLQGGDLSAAAFFGGDAGLFWHYHPIVFMLHANRLIRRESVEIAELTQAQKSNVNCLLDQDGFIRSFVKFDRASNDYTSIAATSAAVHPIDASRPAAYTATLVQIGCRGPGPHVLNEATPTRTRFSVTLLNLIEDIRAHANLDVRIKSAHVCANHSSRLALCVRNNATSMQEHENGLAADIVLASSSVANCKTLIDSANFVQGRFQADRDQICGNPAFGDVPLGIQNFVVEHAGAPTTAAAAAAFAVHLALR